MPLIALNHATNRAQHSMVCAVQGQLQPGHGNDRHGTNGGGNRRSQRQQQRQRSGKPPLDDSMSEFYESKQKKQALLDNIEPAAKRVLVSMIHDALFLMAIESHYFQRPTQSLQVYVWEFWNISWIKIDDEDLPLIVPKNHGGSTAPFTAEEVTQLTQHHEFGNVLQKIKNRQDSLKKVCMILLFMYTVGFLSKREVSLFGRPLLILLLVSIFPRLSVQFIPCVPLFREGKPPTDV